MCQRNDSWRHFLSLFSPPAVANSVLLIALAANSTACLSFFIYLFLSLPSCDRIGRFASCDLPPLPHHPPTRLQVATRVSGAAALPGANVIEPTTRCLLSARPRSYLTPPSPTCEIERSPRRHSPGIWSGTCPPSGANYANPCLILIGPGQSCNINDYGATE